jgi:hypothetical protein
LAEKKPWKKFTFPLNPYTTININENHIMKHNENAEKLNGRLAMLGIVAALGAYALSGQIIPGVW